MIWVWFSIGVIAFLYGLLGYLLFGPRHRFAWLFFSGTLIVLTIFYVFAA